MSAAREPLEVRDVRLPPMPAQPRPFTRPPEFGALSPTDAHPAVVRRPPAEILNGFVEQELRFPLGNRMVCVSAAPGPDTFPFAHPVLLLSTSVRDYGPWPRDIAVDHIPAVALAGDRQWLDRMLLVRDGPSARALAEQSPAPYALRWDEAGMAVIEATSGQTLRRFGVRARELTYRCCPLIADAAPGDRCRMYGGGSISKAIVAAGYWLDRRHVFLEELGCDEACGEPSVREDPRLPTRYFTWLTEREIAEQWSAIVGLAAMD
jgi:hypothetical protein